MMKRFINIYTDEMVTQLRTFADGDIYYKKDNPVIIVHKTSSGIIKRIRKLRKFRKPGYVFATTHRQVNNNSFNFNVS